jgi:lipopolysaccharide transport system ATP-binding protein
MLYGMQDLTRNMLGMRSASGGSQSPKDLTLRRDEFWALKNVSFDLMRGEVLGVIGANGSGKSTLLRLLTGIFPPDGGEIVSCGRVGALIALGAGFHPHMTGRENVYLNGTILGMNRCELDEKFKDIVEFAEIGEFLDAPVSTYSSGMTVRLGFAIAIHSNPDIVIIDEVLAVGDAQFQRKCLDKVNDLRRQGKSLILVSHNMLNIKGICERSLLLHHGEQIALGPTGDVIPEYELKLAEQGGSHSRNRISQQPSSCSGNLHLVWKNDAFGTDELKVRAVSLKRIDGLESVAVKSTDEVYVDVKVESAQKIETVNLWLAVNHVIDPEDDSTSTTCVGASKSVSIPEGVSTVQIRFGALRLATGSYKIALYFNNESYDTPYASGHFGYFTVTNPMPTLMRPGKGTPFVWIDPEVEVMGA